MNSGAAEGRGGNSCCSMLSCYSFDHQVEKNDLKHKHCKEFKEIKGVITIHTSETKNDRQHNGQKTNISVQEESKIPKVKSEPVYRGRTDSTMAKRKKEKQQSTRSV